VLACVRSRDAALWEILVARLQPVFARVVYRVASNTSAASCGDVDDAVQECFLKLGAMSGKSYLGSAAFNSHETAMAYLKTVAANTARDYFRKKQAEKRSMAKTSSLEDRLSDIMGCDGLQLERDVLIQQIDGMLGGDRQERTIFWLYYRQGFTAKEIAQLPAFQLGPKGVESLLRRLTLAIQRQIAEGFSGTEAS
jgi:RNA polymerase sigma-70 factor, ECF subfamily